MAFVDYAAAHSGPPLIAALRRVFGDWRAARRARLQQHLALQSLLFMPQHRLNDLGISRDQLIQTMEIHRK